MLGTRTMGNNCCPCPLRSRRIANHSSSGVVQNIKFTICVFGLDGAGKTDIIHRLIDRKRVSFDKTNGCWVVEHTINGQTITVCEIGGALNVRDIWPHYFVDTHAVVYVVDAANSNRLHENTRVLRQLVHNNYLIGKPFLVLANKQDLVAAIDKIDLCNLFNIEELANETRTPCLVDGVGREQFGFSSSSSSSSPSASSDTLAQAFEWLVWMVAANFRQLSNRIAFDGRTTATSNAASHDNHRLSHSRPQSAANGDEHLHSLRHLRLRQRPVTAPLNRKRRIVATNEDGYFFYNK